MSKRRIAYRGVVLLFVLFTFCFMLILASIILNIMASQAKLSHHRVSRIQAYYAARAGINYVLDRIRLGGAFWTANTTYNWTICPKAAPGCNMVDNNFPISIDKIVVQVSPWTPYFGPDVENREIKASVYYNKENP